MNNENNMMKKKLGALALVIVCGLAAGFAGGYMAGNLRDTGTSALPGLPTLETETILGMQIQESEEGLQVLDARTTVFEDGDWIEAVDDVFVDTIDEMEDTLENRDVGENVTISIMRANQPMDISVTIEQNPDANM